LRYGSVSNGLSQSGFVMQTRVSVQSGRTSMQNARTNGKTRMRRGLQAFWALLPRHHRGGRENGCFRGVQSKAFIFGGRIIRIRERLFSNMDARIRHRSGVGRRAQGISHGCTRIHTDRCWCANDFFAGERRGTFACECARFGGIDV